MCAFKAKSTAWLEPASIDFILWLHRAFYRDAPDEMLRIRGADANSPVSVGEWLLAFLSMTLSVGRHLPPSSEHVDAFMHHFESRYRFATMGKAGRIMAIAAAHHRLNFVHPFPDGNGRVSRLMSHAIGLSAGIGAHGLWSVSRGLARGLESRGEYKRMMDEYKRMMDYADTPRQGDLDGRGNLSQRALHDFGHSLVSARLPGSGPRSRQVCFDLDSLAGRLLQLRSLATKF